MKAIGGYFEAEKIGDEVINNFDRALLMQSGRSSLHFILSQSEILKIYIPEFLCDVILEPIRLLELNYEFYPLSPQLELDQPIALKANEVILYINYFGLKTAYGLTLSENYGKQLILDNTHDFFFVPPVTFGSWSFNSVRKFLGTPDGSLLYCPINHKINAPIDKNTSYRIDHLTLRSNGFLEEGYAAYKKNEELMNSANCLASDYTKHVLENINLKKLQEQRQANYSYLHEKLKHLNVLPLLLDRVPFSPFSYPLMLENELNHVQLWNLMIFSPVLWPNCLAEKTDQYTIAYRYSKHILHLPIDHRYTVDDMEEIINRLVICGIS